MYLTVCPLRGSGHDSSVGEWMNHTVCPPVAWVQFPAMAKNFKGVSLADHTLPTPPEPA